MKTMMRPGYPEGAITGKDIEGLVKYTQLMAKKFPDLDMLEIGAWKGKSAVVIAKELLKIGVNITLHSIDPHNGFKDYTWQNCAPTHNVFCSNMRVYGVDRIVNCIREKAEDAEWDRPISFLFIDGLHGYEDVKHDFEKFEPYVAVGGYIALHDYFGFWKDVKKYVLAEVLQIGIRPNKPKKRFRKVERRGSAIYLEKIHG